MSIIIFSVITVTGTTSTPVLVLPSLAVSWPHATRDASDKTMNAATDNVSGHLLMARAFD
jgi:hypothetical protein